jgi:low temperature requirement protein LtrA
VQDPGQRRAPHLTATLRGDVERVMPLELFFDLVFVLAITQCSALMVGEPVWSGLVKGLLVLGVLWWSWVGYAWLTSVVDPEEGTVRLALFAAMAATLIVALCVPGAFSDDAVLFACAYGAVRVAHIWLFVLASRDDPNLRHSVVGLAISTGIGVGLLLVAAFTDGLLQGVIWALALLLDMGGPLVIDSSGWRLVPGHFAERHGLVVLIALGESIVAIGVGSEVGLSPGVVVAAALATAVAASLFWLYFDVVALVAARRLQNAPAGKERNEIARDSFSYLHFPMVAGIVLVAVGFEETIVHVGAHLHAVAATALLGGAAVYLLAHVAFRWRNVHRFSRQRVAAAVVCIAAIPLAVRVPALATLAGLELVLAVLIADERRRFAELRDRLRHQLAVG